MKNKAFKILSFFIIICLCLGISCAAYADLGYDEYVLDPEGFIPYGDGLTSNNQKAAEISSEYSMVVSIAVLEERGERDPLAVSDEIYYNYFGGFDGIIFLRFHNEMENFIFAYGRAAELYNDDDARRMGEAFNAPEYYDDCVLAYLEETEAILNEKTEAGLLVLSDGTETADNPDAVVIDENVGEDAIPTERQQPRLADNADLLSPEEEAELSRMLDEISERQELDVVLVTMPNFGGKTPQAFADDYFDYEGFGYGEEYNGILFAIDMENRNWAISTHGFGRTAFNDNGQSYMTGEFLPMLSEGDYYGAFSKYAEICDEFIEMARDGKPYDKAENGTDRSFWISWIPISLIIGFVIALISAKKQKAKLKSVHAQYSAGDYTRPGSTQLWCNEDIYLDTNLTRREIERENTGSRSSGGGSSSHTSSSGRTHGGSSGSF